jgi:hypothetical protein
MNTLQSTNLLMDEVLGNVISANDNNTWDFNVAPHSRTVKTQRGITLLSRTDRTQLLAIQTRSNYIMLNFATFKNHIFSDSTSN